jgi:hypothetical protein
MKRERKLERERNKERKEGRKKESEKERKEERKSGYQRHRDSTITLGTKHRSTASSPSLLKAGDPP